MHKKRDPLGFLFFHFDFFSAFPKNVEEILEYFHEALILHLDDHGFCGRMKDDALGSEDIEIPFFRHRAIDEPALPTEVRIFIVKCLFIIIHIEDNHFPADLSLLGDLKILFETLLAHDVIPWCTDGSGDIVGRTDRHSFHGFDPKSFIGLHPFVDSYFRLIGFREELQASDEIFGDIFLPMDVLKESIRIECLEMSDVLPGEFGDQFFLQEFVERLINDASVELCFPDDFPSRCLPCFKQCRINQCLIRGQVKFFELCERLMVHDFISRV